MSLLSNGPLDPYRKLASFDWKQMKKFVTGVEMLKFENILHEEMLKHPILYKQELSTPSLNEQRRITVQKLTILYTIIENITKGKRFTSLETLSFLNSVFALDASLGVKYVVNSNLFADGLLRMGSERHRNVAERASRGEVYGCVCLTEVAHGTNPQGLRTTATYDVRGKRFLLNTPDFEAAKCYISSGKTAQYAIVYANLILPTGENRGVHPFLVELHDSNLKPLVGVTTADLGHKIGLNGVDNAIITFNQHPIPLKSLLNQIGDVAEDGTYIANTTNLKDIYRINLKGFSESRVRTLAMATSYLVKALTIAVRYAAVRKQFAPSDGEEEVSIIEYQTHQYRLFPYLALAYASKFFCEYVYRNLSSKFIDSSVGEELHAITCGAKSVVVWLVRDAIQECREACGGHGYLKASALGDIRNSNDLNCTSEGENNVVIQQTSNWLLKKWATVLKKEPVENPLRSIDFLNEAENILATKFSGKIMGADEILTTFRWLICYLLKETYDKHEMLIKRYEGVDAPEFHARNESQVFYAKTLATVYLHYHILEVMKRKIDDCDNVQLQNVLTKLLRLFGCWCLDKHTLKLYSGGYILGTNATRLVQDTILSLCAELKTEVVSLVDAIAHPDFILNSVLGYSDGEVYKRLEAAIFQNPHSFGRPSWWPEILEQQSMFSKL
ncbi:hypothetical protein FQR65_LT16476 [Abscondita terminalis]|nr:hypothetical protein FQR65_LT16476 [Abscondita terminalis]